MNSVDEHIGLMATVTNTDRLTPAQMATSYTGPPEEFHQRLEKLTLSVLEHKSVHDKWKITLPEGKSYASLGTEIGTLNFYQMLIRMGGYKNILELGTFIGVSTLYLAEAVGWLGKVTTIESGEEFYALAEGNIKANGMAERVEQVLGDAPGVLIRYWLEMRSKFDFILIDAAKESYDMMIIPALGCLNDNGILLIDDVFFQGETLNTEVISMKGAGVKNMLRKVMNLQGYDKVILPMGNGLLMIRKSVNNQEEPFQHAN